MLSVHGLQLTIDCIFGQQKTSINDKKYIKSLADVPIYRCILFSYYLTIRQTLNTQNIYSKRKFRKRPKLIEHELRKSCN